MNISAVIVVPMLSRHDAVCADARAQCRWLAAAGFDSCIYADIVSEGLEHESISRETLSRLVRDPKTILLYQMCVYWHGLAALLDEARCKVIIKYQNMTPPHFFANYDQGSFFATTAGLNQAKEIARDRRISRFIAGSTFTKGDLEAMSPLASPCEVQAPFVALSDFDAIPAAKVRDDGVPQVLFVGRLVPNKGHQHLIGVIASYVELFNTDIRLVLAGSISPAFRTYHEELIALIAELKLESKITILDQVSFPALVAEYRRSNAFLVMSEHEGFCVPVVEAQHEGLPVLALNRTAVGETLGEGQLLFDEADYDHIATSLNTILTNKEIRERLVQKGYTNKERFSEQKLAKLLVETVRGLS